MRKLEVTIYHFSGDEAAGAMKRVDARRERLRDALEQHAAAVRRRVEGCRPGADGEDGIRAFGRRTLGGRDERCEHVELANHIVNDPWPRDPRDVPDCALVSIE